MLLTKSMRRKLCFAFILVLIPCVLFTVVSIRSISAYKRMIGDLKLSIQNMPRTSELISAVSGLIEPLSINFSTQNRPLKISEELAFRQHYHFLKAFNKVKVQVQQFETDYRMLPATLSHSGPEQMAYTTMFLSIDRDLNLIEQDIEALKNPDLRDASIQEILRFTAKLIEVIQAVPDPSNRLAEKVHSAESEYRFYQNILIACAIVTGVALLGLVYWGYELIFVPIRDLQRGVQRVAQGDYGYKLDVGTQCELSYTAHAFNDMTAKIQQDQQDKEREIEQRSKQLILSERLLGAGFLASGVAHEINNPLAVIMAAAYGLSLDIEGILEHASDELRDEIKMGLDMIQSQAERCTTITAKLLEFSHGKPGERNMYDVTAIANEVVDMVSHLSRYQDRKVTVNQSLPMHAYLCGPEIKQVVLNLVANGLDACQPGGGVSLTINEYHEQVEIVVKDNGIGMTPEQLDNIFEPFFTTKEVGKGTGLGLSISHQIIKNHGGTLEVHSDGPGRGSSFSLRLPKTEAFVKAA